MKQITITQHVDFLFNVCIERERGGVREKEKERERERERERELTVSKCCTLINDERDREQQFRTVAFQNVRSSCL